jgi:hypothetical protein
LFVFFVVKRRMTAKSKQQGCGPASANFHLASIASKGETHNKQTNQQINKQSDKQLVNKTNKQNNKLE